MPIWHEINCAEFSKRWLFLVHNTPWKIELSDGYLFGRVLNFLSSFALLWVYMLLFPQTGRGGNWQRLWRMEGKWFLALLTSLQVQMLELVVNLKNAMQLFCCWSKINKVCNFMQRSLNLLRAYIIYDLCQENWNAFACIMCNETFLWLHIWCLPYVGNC